jgi:hypothetical protein
MGRKKLHKTKEQLLEQQRARAKRYYDNHRERLNAASMQRYWEKKETVSKKNKIYSRNAIP